MTNSGGDNYQRSSRKLYKNPDKAKIFGVCAGLAEYFDVELWVARIVVVSFALFSNGFGFIAYVVASFILDPKPDSVSNRGCFGSEKMRDKPVNSENRKYTASVKDIWKKGQAPTDTLSQLEDTFETVEQRLQQMETYVTSNQYQLEKAFQNIK